eukprot:scaffold8432_cov66-Skeletonema_dohrnii-CCMP3373.AAC.1
MELLPLRPQLKLLPPMMPLLRDDSVDRLSSGGSSRPWRSGNDDGQDELMAWVKRSWNKDTFCSSPAINNSSDAPVPLSSDILPSSRPMTAI